MDVHRPIPGPIRGLTIYIATQGKGYYLLSND